MFHPGILHFLVRALYIFTAQCQTSPPVSESPKNYASHFNYGIFIIYFILFYFYFFLQITVPGGLLQWDLGVYSPQASIRDIQSFFSTFWSKINSSSSHWQKKKKKTVGPLPAETIWPSMLCYWTNWSKRCARMLCRTIRS